MSVYDIDANESMVLYFFNYILEPNCCFFKKYNYIVNSISDQPIKFSNIKINKMNKDCENRKNE